MKRVFLATSFSEQVDAATGAVLPEFRRFIEQTMKGLRETAGVGVFCAVEHEGWKLSGVPPEIGVQKDLEQLDNSDVLLALIGERPSVGVQFELGYAAAKAKQVILAAQSTEHLAYFNQGLISSGRVTLVTYGDAKALIDQLTVALNALEAA